MGRSPDIARDPSRSRSVQGREIAERLQAGKEEVCAAPDCREGWQARDLLANWTLGHFEFQRAVLVADDRIAFVSEFVKVPVVRPDILRELELPDKAAADHKGRDSSV